MILPGHVVELLPIAVLEFLIVLGVCGVLSSVALLVKKLLG